MLRHWAIVTICAVLLSAAAMIVTLNMPPTYEATAKVLVHVSYAVPIQDPRGMVTALELVKNPEFAQSAAASMGPSVNATEALSRVGASVVANTNIIAVTAKGETATEAAGLANGVAMGLVDWANATERRRRRREATAEAALVDEAAKKLAVLNAKTNGPPAPSAAATDPTYLATKQSLDEAILHANEAWIGAQMDEAVLELVVRAAPPNRPVPAPTARNGAVGLVLGLLLGLGAALLLDHVRKRPHSAADPATADSGDARE